MDQNKDYQYIHEVKGSAASEAIDRFLHRKILTPFLAFVLVALCISGTAGVFLFVSAEPKATLDELYSAAAIDAVTIERMRFSRWFA